MFSEEEGSSKSPIKSSGQSQTSSSSILHESAVSGGGGSSKSAIISSSHWLASSSHTCNFQGWGLRAGEWREGGPRVDAFFNRLAQALSSNEQFEMDDSFQLSITQVHHAPQGSGKHSRHLTPGNQFPKLFTQNKKTVIRIQNDDDRCCARALVTAKAKVNQHPKWNSIRQGTNLQRELALLLHEEAHVPPGPCRYEELVKFSAAPSLYDYQILLVDADHAYHVKSFGPTQPKQLILLQEKDHYDVITSLPGFFNKSYVCVTCFQTYNNEGRHRCTKKVECRACCQKECPDFLHAYPRGLKATRRCDECGRDFFSEILVTRPIAPKPEMEKWHRPIKKPSVTFNVAVWVALN